MDEVKSELKKLGASVPTVLGCIALGIFFGICYGCGTKVEDDREVSAVWTYHGRDVCTKIVELDGHKYIIMDGNYSGNIIHAASCGCMNK